MTRAGREPAEDVVRRIVTACRAAGLVISRRMNSLLRDHGFRLVCVWASRRDWPHAAPMFEVQAAVDLTGTVRRVRVLCAATDDDPVAQVWTAPTVRDAEAELDTLPGVLRLVLRERDAVVQMVNEGQQPPFKGLHWTWEVIRWGAGGLPASDGPA